MFRTLAGDAPSDPRARRDVAEISQKIDELKR
jgi:hypothetical protein